MYRDFKALFAVMTLMAGIFLSGRVDNMVLRLMKNSKGCCIRMQRRENEQ